MARDGHLDLLLDLYSVVKELLIPPPAMNSLKKEIKKNNSICNRIKKIAYSGINLNKEV